VSFGRDCLSPWSSKREGLTRLGMEIQPPSNSMLEGLAIGNWLFLCFPKATHHAPVPGPNQGANFSISSSKRGERE
jgi:hypothetical protein